MQTESVSLDRKRLLHAGLVAALRSELEQVTAAQREAAAGATHEDARAESDKDMRSTEASYLARGHAMRVEALAEDLALAESMQVVSFAPGDPIGPSAVVVLEDERGRLSVFVAPAGGGTRLDAGGVVQVVTPASPLGRALVGAREGDDVEVERAGRIDTLSVVQVG